MVFIWELGFFCINSKIMCLNKTLCYTKIITGRIYEAPGSVVIVVLQTGRSDGAQINIHSHLTCASVFFLQALDREQRQRRNTKPLIYYFTEHTSNNNEQVSKFTVI